MNIKTKLQIDYYLGTILHTILKPIAYLLGMLLKRNHSIDKIESICFLKLLGGGSLAIAYPSLRAIRESARFSRITLVATSSTAIYAKCLDVFDEIIVIDDSNFIRLISTSLHAIIRIFNFDAIVDMEFHSRLSVVFALTTCARNRISFFSTSSFWRKNLSTHLIYFNNSAPVYHFYDQIARALNCSVRDFEYYMTHFKKTFHANTSKPRPDFTVGFAPFCSPLSPERQMTSEQWRLILLRLSKTDFPTQKNVHILIFGSPSEESKANTLLNKLRPTFPNNHITIESIAGKYSLRQSVAELTKLDCFVSIDSGLLHLARLLGLTTYSFWGPTSPKLRLRQNGLRNTNTFYHPFSCSPCAHVSISPPCMGNNVCMKAHTDKSFNDNTNIPWIIR